MAYDVPSGRYATRRPAYEEPGDTYATKGLSDTSTTTGLSDTSTTRGPGYEQPGEPYVKYGLAYQVPGGGSSYGYGKGQYNIQQQQQEQQQEPYLLTPPPPYLSSRPLPPRTTTSQDLTQSLPPPRESDSSMQIALTVTSIAIILLVCLILFLKRKSIQRCFLRSRKERAPPSTALDNQPKDAEPRYRPPIPAPRPKVDSFYQGVEYSADGYVMPVGAKEREKEKAIEDGYWDPSQTSAVDKQGEDAGSGYYETIPHDYEEPHKEDGTYVESHEPGYMPMAIGVDNPKV